MQPEKKFAFDPTINLGHLLTFLGFVLTGLVSWQSLNTRLVVLEENRKLQSLRDNQQDDRANQQSSQLADAILDLKKSVEKLNDKLDRQH